ncbi:MAG: hypothetical protein HQL59_09195, partial [Magnetococcales bacterium]|nr:hypothetical protein [Magnetococcales bacterium]
MDFDALYEILEVMTTFEPVFLTVGFLLNDRESLELRRRFQNLLDARAAANPAWVPFARHFRGQPSGAEDLLTLLEAHLRQHPRDRVALRNKGWQLLDLERFGEAAEAFHAAHRAYPFMTREEAGVAVWLRALVRAGRSGEALDIARRVAQDFNADVAAADLEAELLVVTALFEAGEKGEARRRLEPLLERHADHAPLRALAARLELASDRPGEAVTHAREAVLAQPQQAANRALLVEALGRDGKGDQAIEAFRAALGGLKYPTEELFLKGADAYRKREDWPALVASLEEATSVIPGSSQLRVELSRGLFDAGRRADAFNTLKTLLLTRAAGKNEAELFRSFALATLREDAALSAIEALRASQGWNRNLWIDAASRLEPVADHQAALLTLWEQARRANPEAPWVLQELISLHRTLNHWEEAEALLREAELREDAPVMFRRMVLTQRAITILEAPAHLRKREEMVAHAKRLADQRGMISESDYWWYTRLLAEETGEAATQEEALIRYLEIRPDSDLMGTLFAAEGEKIERFRPLYLWRYLDRDPFNPRKLEVFAHRHGWWLGSDLGALWAYDRLKRVSPRYASDNGVDQKIASVYNRLGDASREIQDYLDSSAIAPSDRYVGWFDATRKKAEADLGQTRVTFDAEAVRAEIRRPDGEVVVLESDLRTAKPTLVKKGGASVRATYDDRALLIGLEGSSGQRIDLDYDEKARIVAIRQKGGGEMRIRYGLLDKPEVIEVENLGRLVVAYDSEGEILSVRSEPLEESKSPEGSSQGVSKPEDAGLAWLSGSPEAGIAGAISARFQELMRLVRAFEEKSIDLPELPIVDGTAAALREAFERAGPLEAESTGAALKLAEYLIDHAGEQRSYVDEARALLDPLLTELVNSGGDREAAIRALGLWHRLALISGESGLTQEEWDRWVELRDAAFLAELRGELSGQSRAVVRTLVAQPLRLLPSAHWLPRSDLSNPGRWRHFSGKELGPVGRGAAAVLVRGNRDVVVAGAESLEVLRRGYWESFVPDRSQGRLVRATGSGGGLGALSLTEDRATGVLWIGTTTGVIRLSGDYTDAATFWSEADGQPDFRAERIIPFGDRLLAVGPQGVRLFAEGREESLPRSLRELAVRGAQPLPIASAGGEAEQEGKRRPGVALLAGDQGIILLVGNEVKPLSSFPADEVFWDASEKRLFVRRGDGVFSAPWDAGALESVGEFLPLDVAGIEGGLGRVNGLVGLSTGDDLLPAVLTDKGVGVWQERHLEMLPHPARSISGNASGALWLLGDGSLSRFGGERVVTERSGRVHDLLALPGRDRVLIARGDRLELSESLGAGLLVPLETLAAIRTTHLALDADGRVVADDGPDIVRLTSDLRDWEVLFTAEPTVDEKRIDPSFNSRISSLIVARDGVIWATRGPSLFRWEKGELREFSMFVDPKAFPAKSDALSRVVETIDGRIWVVASDEGHRQIDGETLRGGLFEYTPDGFRRLDLTDIDDRWFITGYTPIAAGKAIVGTAKGFVLHQSGHFTPFTEVQDSSYAELRRKQKALWLGRRGAPLGANAWLFGTAGGVVGLRDGKWFRPDRLNALLPDFASLPYGGLTVHAVETNRQGDIYVGTDRGLLIHSTGGDWFDLMIEEGETAAAFAEVQRERLEAAVSAPEEASAAAATATAA